MYGTTIKQLMKKHSFDTIYELAVEAKISPIGLTNIVNDKVKKPNRATLKKLCEVFELSVSDIKTMAQKAGGQ